jgi:hypothetical protein
MQDSSIRQWANLPLARSVGNFICKLKTNRKIPTDRNDPTDEILTHNLPNILFRITKSYGYSNILIGDYAGFWEIGIWN